MSLRSKGRGHLCRLSRQVDYDRYCDGNYVVAGSTHGLHRGTCARSGGIITVEAAVGADLLREAGAILTWI